MGFNWSLEPEARSLLERVEGLAAGVVRQNARDVDRRGRFPMEAIACLREAGLLGLIGATEVGGLGQGLRTAAAAVERLARECPSTAMIVLMHYAASAVIERHGTPEVRHAVAAGGRLATLAFSEQGSRSHFWIPVGTATRRGGEIVLDGAKQLVTSAGHCDLYVWSSRPAGDGGELSTLWAVPSSISGLSVERPFDGLGLRGNSSAPVLASGVAIPESSRLGEDGRGLEIMLGVVLPFFSLQGCAASIGMMEGAFDRTVAHATGARFGHDGSRIADLPQVRGHIARMRLKIDMVRGFLLDAIAAAEEGRDDATLRVLEAKAAGSESALEVHDLAMRVCGGAAFRKDVDVERYFRDGRAATVMAPVTDALYEFIGRAVCGMPVFG